MRRIRISACMALALLVGKAYADDFADLVQRGVQMQQAGDDAGAAQAYRSALRLKPEDVATHVNLGVVLVHLGRFDEAIAEYHAAEKQLPGDERIQLNMALAYEKSGRIQEARGRFETLHAAAPADKKLTMLLADSELQLGHDERVIEMLEPLERTDETDLGIAYMLGIALLRKGRMAEGQVQLDRILRNGDTAEARFLLGTRMFESGDYPAAVKQLASAAGVNAHLPQLQSLYGRALLNTGDPKTAADAFREELTTNPGDYEANLGLAQVLVVQKNLNEALPLAQRALRLRGDSAPAKLAVAECLAGARRYREAWPYAQGALATLPESAEAHETMAAVYDGVGRPADAKSERQKAQSLASEADPGLKVRDTAPDFALGDAVSGKQVRLRDLRNKRPVALVFGSYSCPNFRDSALSLIRLYRQYGDRANFLLVYIREAHAEGAWQSTRNTNQNVTLTSAGSYAEKQEHANVCSRKLHLPFRAVVDGMDGAVEKMYKAWPSRVFVIGEDGRVRYGSRLTELDFHPAEMEAALRQSVR